MYMLNLLFDPEVTTGRFAASHGRNLLNEQSRVWLRVDVTDPEECRELDPESPELEWRAMGGEGSLLVHAAARPFIAVRIAPVRPIGGDDVLHATITFGREMRALQPYASPFTSNDDPSGPVSAVFDFHNLSRRNREGGWYLPLKPIAHVPECTYSLHRYEFAVGVRYGDRSYGHDPQMDVTL
jgi:hypothetical protein